MDPTKREAEGSLTYYQLTHTKKAANGGGREQTNTINKINQTIKTIETTEPKTTSPKKTSKGK